MGWTNKQRLERRFSISSDDQRSAFERDRDRILYSSAFHRLAGVTQIVRAGELDIFHTRQQHTFKVSQIGRRLAQHCLASQEELARHHGVDAEVVEAACFAHDLGHPPFGHAAEVELDRLVLEKKDPDGYEGNAQTLRILTKLSVRYGMDQCFGLDLTRATLAACLKYPWFRDHEDEKKSKKWSAYATEKTDFEWAREYCPIDIKTAEAEIMDWADDIAYSVHDLEDFHRVGIVPWELITNERKTDFLVNEVLSFWKNHPADASSRIRRSIKGLRETLMIFPAVSEEKYNGSREQRRQLRNFTSILIGRYVRSLSLSNETSQITVEINEASADEVRVLKHMARMHVIGLPALHAQQFGQRRIVSDVFSIFYDLSDKNLDLVPIRLRGILTELDGSRARKVADCISCLTENELIQLHKRLTGREIGSVLDPIVR